MADSTGIPYVGNFYRHYKGDLVEVISVGTETESGRTMVGYVHKGRVWYRWLEAATNPRTGEPSGWCDLLPDGRTRFVWEPKALI